ncbi:MAG: YfjI family protein [Planctomycetota bacterium]
MNLPADYVPSLRLAADSSGDVSTDELIALAESDDPAERHDARVRLFDGPPIDLNNQQAPPLPADLIPGVVGEMIEAVAEATETPRELAVVFAIGTLGAIGQSRFRVRVEANYFEPLCPWLISPMEPGNRKTAVMSAMTNPLARFEFEMRREMADDIAAAEAKQKTLKARVDHLQGRAAKVDDDAEFDELQEKITEARGKMGDVPQPPRYWCEDTTPEKLGTLMADNGEAMSLISDEGGLFENFGGRYSNNVPNLDLLLKAHSGSPIRVDRGTRPSVAMNRPKLTVALAPQPHVMHGLIGKPGFKGRGLLDRFLYLLPTSRLGYRSLQPKSVPDELSERYERLLRDLASVELEKHDEMEREHLLRLDDEAYATWKAFQREVEQMLRPDAELGQLQGWGSKLPGGVARIASLLHLAEQGSHAVHDRVITNDAMTSAVTLGRLFITHARIAFDAMGGRHELECARDLWRVITGLRQDSFTARDAWNPLRGTYKTTREAEPGFALLIDHNLIYERDADAFRTRGRPSRVFYVHPEVAEDWQ